MPTRSVEISNLNTHATALLMEAGESCNDVAVTYDGYNYANGNCERAWR